MPSVEEIRASAAKNAPYISSSQFKKGQASVFDGTGLVPWPNDADPTIASMRSLDTDDTLAANSDSVVASQKAVKTYVDETSRPQFCVLNYGAEGDGITDDTAAIAATIAAATAAGGGLVYFPKGTYLLGGSTTLSTSEGVVLTGVGYSSTVVLNGGASAWLKLNGIHSGISVLCIQRGSATPTRMVQVSAADCFIQNTTFEGATYSGDAIVFGVGASGLSIIDNTFDTIVGIGVKGYCTSLVSDVTICRNHFKAHNGSAINFNPNVAYFVINDNIVLTDPTSTTGVPIGGVTSTAGSVLHHGVISGNYVETGYEGIAFGKTSSGDRPFALAITGNTIKMLGSGSDFAGISCPMIDYSTITGNVIDGNGIEATTGTNCGIEIPSGCTYITVANNAILAENSLKSGINAIGSNHCTITGNTIKGFRDIDDGHAIWLYANATYLNASDNTIVGNHIMFPTGTTGARPYGILVQTNNASANANRNVIVGNQIYGNNATNSRGIAVYSISGTVDRNLIGMNISLNLVAPIYQSGDTNTLLSGTTWNLTT